MYYRNQFNSRNEILKKKQKEKIKKPSRSRNNTGYVLIDQIVYIPFTTCSKVITIICKNTDVPEPIVIIDPITQLKQQIEEAKSAKVLTKIRILLSFTTFGHRITKRPKNYENSSGHCKIQPPQELLGTKRSSYFFMIPLLISPGAPEIDFSLVQIPPSVSQDLPTSPISSSLSETPADKSLRKLEKKLKAIEELKVKREKGEKLENNQVE